MSPRLQHDRGVSLIEALAALAVMAFGLLGVVGMQATLRSNSDVAKQRAEAVRIAQAALEDWRAFEQLDTGSAPAFADIATASGTAVTGDNAAFSRSALVEPVGLPSSAPRLKRVAMSVTWQDRSGQTQAVSLFSSIGGVPPELAGSLGMPGDRAATQRPRGRHAAIPPTAVSESGGGSSSFTPPGAPSGVSWVFNNTTGVITSICQSPQSCVVTDALLLSGFVRFATGGDPAAIGSENPVPQPTNALPPAVGVRVVLTEPAGAPDVACFTEATSLYTSYYCAVPTASTVPRSWSGQSVVIGLPIAASGGVSTTEFRVCRYTPEANHTPAGGNVNHPLNYTAVTGPLSRQNFLVISAGNGSAPYSCPPDGPSSFVNTTTYPHQPAS